jgi:hypothetical protein
MGAVATNEWGREVGGRSDEVAPGIRALSTATGDGRGGIEMRRVCAPLVDSPGTRIV